ncbi:unnamed protein product [Acidithrix sp. C25]|nr:unnamed protein product [Acidithrix sp. C25]
MEFKLPKEIKRSRTETDLRKIIDSRSEIFQESVRPDYPLKAKQSDSRKHL